ncbi:MAG: hypothetical protein KatS3mg003_1796 [Candidatus Nitrosocaldaceae archaeon]|nr:MAG: hypothetical protein KatS3mg003_1796 [Candidatus Nitrosocaldaceae archaeon]
MIIIIFILKVILRICRISNDTIHSNVKDLIIEYNANVTNNGNNTMIWHKITLFMNITEIIDKDDIGYYYNNYTIDRVNLLLMNL